MSFRRVPIESVREIADPEFEHPPMIRDLALDLLDAEGELERAKSKHNVHAELLSKEIARLRGELHKERDNTLVAAEMKREGDAEIARLTRELAEARAAREPGSDPLGDALNSGDGSYRP